MEGPEEGDWRNQPLLQTSDRQLKGRTRTWVRHGPRTPAHSHTLVLKFFISVLIFT